MKTWLKVILILFALFLLVIIAGGILVLVIEQTGQANSVSRAVVCSNAKDSCLYECDQKLVGYFCEKDCEKSYDRCMNEF